jgi:hypothetical protein
MSPPDTFASATRSFDLLAVHPPETHEAQTCSVLHPDGGGRLSYSIEKLQQTGSSNPFNCRVPFVVKDGTRSRKKL